MVPSRSILQQKLYHLLRSNDCNINDLTQTTNYIRFESELWLIIVWFHCSDNKSIVSKSARLVIKIGDELLFVKSFGHVACVSNFSSSFWCLISLTKRHLKKSFQVKISTQQKASETFWTLPVQWRCPVFCVIWWFWFSLYTKHLIYRNFRRLQTNRTTASHQFSFRYQ